MRRWRASVVGLVLMAHAAVLAAERPASVHLVEVTSESTEASQSVLITATAPASYTARQPDPLTVLITLRDVAAGDVATWLRPEPDDPVTSVEVREDVDGDGSFLTHVRIGLREPTVFEVRSRRQTIQVRFARLVGSTPTPAPEAAAPASPLVGHNRPATALLSVGVEVEPDAISVTLHGNGALSPGLIHEAEHLPPRLVIEFPHLAAEAASLTAIELDPVKQVRVTASTPDLTRVVLDLARPAVYHVEQLEGNDRVLRVVFARDPALDPVAGIGGDPEPETEAPSAWEVAAATPELIAAGPALGDDGSTTVAVAGERDAEIVTRIEAMAERRAHGESSNGAPAMVVAEPVDVTALAPVTRLPGPGAVRLGGSPLLHPRLADLPRRPVWEGREIARLDRVVAFIADTAPLLRPVPGDVPAFVWPEISRLDGISAVRDAATTPLLHPDPRDLPSAVDDTVLSVTLPSAVAAVSTSDTAVPTTPVAAVVEPTAVEASATVVQPAAGVTPVALEAVGASETPEVPIAASRQTEQFLPLSSAGRATGAPSPRVAVQLPGQQTDGQQEFTGFPISMDFQNTDLHAVLRVFAEISELSIVIDPSVQGEVNVALTQVPWDQAFDIILRTNQLDYEVDGTVVRIASVDQLADEAEARSRLAQAQENAGELVLYTRTLSYARADDLVTLITSTTLSPNGQVFVDPRTNTLIIRDLADRLTAVSDLLDTLDRAEPQVVIEARIVQAGHDSARALGVQWGVTGRVAQEIGNTLPFSFPNRGGISGRVGAAEGQGPSGRDSRALADENAGTVVNLGVGAATSAIGLTLGSVNGSLNLDVVLSALENEGELRIISSPRIMTQNNVEAEILQGDQIPYQTVANNTVTVQFKEAALTLRVTPQITASNTVIMQVELENSFPDFARALGDPPIPPIVTQRARTTVQVRDGETTVIGGIFENTQTQRSSRTPALHRIPLLGWLFKSSDRSESTDELMIFLTPQIVR